MVVLKNGRFLCLGRECYSVCDPSEVIDPTSDDYQLWVGVGARSGSHTRHGKNLGQCARSITASPSPR
jgi:hypothetical protein